jgi:hypothetical protein
MACFTVLLLGLFRCSFIYSFIYSFISHGPTLSVNPSSATKIKTKYRSTKTDQPTNCCKSTFLLEKIMIFICNTVCRNISVVVCRRGGYEKHQRKNTYNLFYKKKAHLVGFQVLTAASIKIIVFFYNITQCSLVEIDRRFRGAY